MGESREYQTEFYSSCARVRDRKSRLRKAAKISFVLTNLTAFPLASATCLDLGCSSGTITSSLASLFSRTLGLDYDEVALKNIDHTGRAGLTFLRGDAMNLPVASSSVDVVICAQVYEHVPDDKTMVAEMYRVLKPGGIVFFSGPNRLFPVEPHYLLPFLHWLPKVLPDQYLRLSGRGENYYEKSRTVWSARSLLNQFIVNDVTRPILLHDVQHRAPAFLTRILARVPMFLWRLLTPFTPNFNWILVKPDPE